MSKTDFNKVLNNPQNPGFSPSQLKGDLDNIILKTLRKEPERRYQSVKDLSEDISNYLNGLPVTARQNTFFYGASKFYARNKTASIVGLFLVLSLIAGIITTTWQAQAARQQRDLAQAEQKKANRINQFLQQMLSFSNQSFTSISPVAQGKNVTVNEMLDQITPHIEAELADQPEVRSKILRTIGSSYASQGFYEKAEKSFRSALETQLQIYGENNVETADTLIELGVLTYRQSKMQEANQLLGKAVLFYRKYQADFPNNSHAKLIQALDFLAVTKFFLGETQTSVALFEEGMKIASEANLQGTEREVLAGIQSDFGGAKTRLGENEKGEALLRQALALYAQISDKPRWEAGNAKTLLATTLINRNALNEAQQELTEGERILRETLGDKNLYLATNLNQQAAVLLQQSEFKPAEKMAREALAIYTSILPPDNLFAPRTLINLGNILTKTGRAKEGEINLREALKINEQPPVKNFSAIVPNKIALSENLMAQNRFAEAGQIALEALTEAQQNLGEQNSITQAAKANLVKIYQKQGKPLPAS